MIPRGPSLANLSKAWCAQKRDRPPHVSYRLLHPGQDGDKMLGFMCVVRDSMTTPVFSVIHAG